MKPEAIHVAAICGAGGAPRVYVVVVAVGFAVEDEVVGASPDRRRMYEYVTSNAVRR